MEGELFCFGGGLGASFLGWGVFELACVVDDLTGGVEGLEGAVVGFLGGFVCLFGVEEVVGLVFLGGNLGIFFLVFSSAICLEYIRPQEKKREKDMVGM